MIESLLIMACYAAVLYISYHLFHKREGEGYSKDINKTILAGNRVSSVFLTPLVFNHWTWATTVIGAAEASILYGISGAVFYSIGASIAFAIMILVMDKYRKMMPQGIFITDFIKKRFSQKTSYLFYILSVAIVLYIQVEMAAGLGFVFNGLFDVSFKVVAFMSVLIAIIFVATTGIRGILYNGLFSFILIISLFLLILFTVTSKFNVDMVYESIQIKIESNSQSILPDFFSIFAMGGLRYFVAAIFIGLGQTTLDPSYYLKSHIAKDRKTFLKSFIIGGILMFIPIAILSGFLFGFTSIALDYDFSSAENGSVLIASRMILEHFGPLIAVLTGALLLVIVMTTLITSSMGIMALASLDIYPNIIDENASDDDGIRFGKIFMSIIVGTGGLLAISLEKISLLTIDIFCGIVFTAAFSVILMGFLSTKKLGDFAAAAAIIGATAGFMIWITFKEVEYNYFYGILVSFVSPLVFLGLISPFVKDEFNFYSLKKYN